MSDDYGAMFRSSPRFRLERSAVLVVDLQKASASRDDGLGALLQSQGRSHLGLGQWRFDRVENLVAPNVRRLLDAFRTRNGTVVYVTLGSERDDFCDVPPYLRW